MVDQLEQDVAPSGRSTGGNLPHDAVLRCSRKIFHSARQIYHDRFRIEPAQQPGHLHGLGHRSSAHRAPEILNGLFAQIARQIRHMFGVLTQTATIETRRELFHGRLRQQFKDIGQPRSHLARLQRLLDKLRHTLLDSHFGSQAARNSRPLRLDAGDEIECLLHRREKAAGGRFLAQPYEGRAHQPLQFRVLLHAQLQTQVPQGFAEQPRIGLGIQFGHLGKSHRGFFPRLGLFAVRASRIILKNADGLGDVALLDQSAHIGLHVARRYTPSLSG